MSNSIIHRIIRWYKRPNKHFLADFVESLIVIVPVVFFIKTFIFGLYQVPTCSMETTMLVGERFLSDKFTPLFKNPQRGEIISFNQPTYQYSDNFLKNLYEQYISFNVQNWTKRVIAVPGDHIQGKIEDGMPVVYLNGEKLVEPYVNKYPIIYRFKDNQTNARSIDLKMPLDKQPFYRFTQAEITRAKLYVGGDNILYPETPTIHFKDNIDIYDRHLGADEYWVMGDNRKGSADSREWGPLNIKKVKFHGRIIFRIWSLDSDQGWWIVDLIQHPIDFWSRVRWSRCFQVIH